LDADLAERCRDTPPEVAPEKGIRRAVGALWLPAESRPHAKIHRWRRARLDATPANAASAANSKPMLASEGTFPPWERCDWKQSRSFSDAEAIMSNDSDAICDPFGFGGLAELQAAWRDWADESL
jgi:hypothetical protein